MNRPPTLLPLLGILFVFQLNVLRADRYDGPLWNFIDAKSTVEASKEITLDKYPNCDSATVDEKITTQYRIDGTGESQDEWYVKILTEKGKQDNRTLSLGFMLPYSTVSVAALEIISLDGTVSKVDVAANSQETIDSSQMGSNIYDPNSKQLEVNIPELHIGDVIHAVTRLTTLRSVIPGEFADENVFEGTGYIRHTTYEVHAPTDKPLKHIVLRNEIPGTITHTEQKTGDQITYMWVVNNVPRMFTEPDMPTEQLQRVLVTTTDSWSDVSKWYWELSQPHLNATSPELKKAVADLTSNAKTDLDKAKALFYRVSQKVRYMGLTPEKDRPGFEPHDVCLTYGKQYGVCRDKAALLVEMLRLAGLNAYPVLVNVGSKKDQEVPAPDFNHAIVALELTKGEYQLMDPTDQHTRDFQPWYDGDQSFLVCRPEGETLKTSPIPPASENAMQIRTTGTLAANGALKATSVLTFQGSNDDVYRNKFSSMKADDIYHYFESRLKKAIPGAKLESLDITPEDMLDVATPITATLTFSADGTIATGNGHSIVTVPWIGSQIGLVNFMLNGTTLDKRKYPLQIEIACASDEQISLKLGSGFVGAESLPNCSSVNDDLMTYGWTYDVKDGALTCAHHLAINKVEYTPAEYLVLKQRLQDIDSQDRKSPVLTLDEKADENADVAPNTSAAPTTPSNVIILKSDKELEATDAHNAVYRIKYTKKILTYAGKIQEGELKYPFNPSLEEAKLVHAVVTSKAGKAQEISAGEINVMDADSSDSAKRYTGDKVLVASFPGVDVGSTVDVDLEITMHDKPLISGFESFQLPNDLEFKSFRLVAPPGLQVQTLLSGQEANSTLKPSKTTEGTQQVLSWTASQTKALPNESHLPPDLLYNLGVGFYLGDYQDYLKQLNSAMLARSHASTKVAEEAQKLAAPDKSQTVKAIRDFVDKSIRNAGPSFVDLPFSELSNADTTFSDGYGNDADRAIVLHAMLTAAGFQPEFVLASDLPNLDKIQKVAGSFPLASNFQVPLVKVTVDGQDLYLNDTDQYAQLGTTDHDGSLGITLADGQSMVIHAAKTCEDRKETTYKLAFDAKGKLNMTTTTHYYGSDYAKQNRYYSQVLPEDRDRHFQKLVSDVDQGARPVGDLVSDFTHYPGTEQFTVDIDNYAVMDGKYCYFNLPFTPSLFNIPGAETRTLPLLLDTTKNETVQTEIDLPPGFDQVLIAPKSQELLAPGASGKAQLTAQVESGKVLLNDEFHTVSAIVDASDYPSLVKLESNLEKRSAHEFLLKKE